MSVTGSLGVASQPKVAPHANTEYDALRDPDLQRFLRAPQTQATLLAAGLLTPDGRILNVESPGMKGRLKVIEQELVEVTEEEQALKKEEATVRARVRALRIQQLEEERRAKMVAIRQEQAAIREEVSRLTKLLTGGAGVQPWQPAPPVSQSSIRQSQSGTEQRPTPSSLAAVTPLRTAGSTLAQSGSSAGALHSRVSFSPVVLPAAGGNKDGSLARRHVPGSS